MRGSKYDDIANLSFANKVLVLFFFDEAVKKQEVGVDVTGGKNAVVAFTPTSPPSPPPPPPPPTLRGQQARNESWQRKNDNLCVSTQKCWKC